MKPVAPVTRAVRPSPGRLASPAHAHHPRSLHARSARSRQPGARRGRAARRRRAALRPRRHPPLAAGAEPRTGSPSCSTPFTISTDSLRERGARLLIRRGDPVKEALEVARDSDADAIHVAEDVSGYAHRRQERLERACERSRHRDARVLGGHVVPPGELVPAGGDHYRVFTPTGARGARGRAPGCWRAPRVLRMPTGLAGAGSRRSTASPRRSPSSGLPAGGETAGRARRVESWLRAGGLSEYGRDEALEPPPGSRLSPYLHLGCLSPGELFARVSEAPRWRGRSFASSAGGTSTIRSSRPGPDLPRRGLPARAAALARYPGLLDAWRAGGPAFRSSTPGCASSRPRASCRTGRG